MMLCRLLEDLDCTLVQGRSDIEVNAICCDSRSVTPGCVFVCLPGQHTDGRRFAHAAAAAGAAVLVFEDTLPNFEFSRSCSPALVQAQRPRQRPHNTPPIPMTARPAFSASPARRRAAMTGPRTNLWRPRQRPARYRACWAKNFID